MITEKRFGAIPTGAPDMTPADLCAQSVAMQNKRADLVERLNELREARDAVKASISALRSTLEAEAHEELAPAKGKTTPAATAVKAYVEASRAMKDLKAEAEQCARDLAVVQDRHDATRSALRVLGQLVEVKLAAVAIEVAGPGSPADEEW